MTPGIALHTARAVALGAVMGAALLGTARTAHAQEPQLLDPGLSVATVVTGLNQPISMAFLGPNDFLVTEKASGQVKRVTNGVVAGVVLDLAVNSNSERGLLGMALHPRFPKTPYVYLYNTESTTGADSAVAAETPLMGNRVDRFIWNDGRLTFDRNLIKLRSFQNDRNNTADPTLPVFRGNHNGGVLRFGPDRKLYVIIGDVGRRGYTQNNLEGPAPDDDFGGPEPDNGHLTGVILRLNDDGTTPKDNPFYAVGRRDRDGRGPGLGNDEGDHESEGEEEEDGDEDADGDGRHGRLPPLSAEARANIQKIFAYGVRNSFGLAFDPKRGSLWSTENGGRAFDEVNRIRAGANNGWIQFMGPLSRVAEFKAIEISVGIGATGPTGLQQARFPATRLSDTPEGARARLFDLPRSRPNDPQFSWKQVVPPAALAFVTGGGLGEHYEGDLIVGSAVARPANLGHLYRFELNDGRTAFQFDDPALADKVADNLALDDFTTEGGEILFGLNFGIVTDMQTGPDGALYLVGPAGTVRKIFKQ